MEYIIIGTKEFNGTTVENNIFYAAPILSGEHKGKYACSLQSLEDFPTIFEDLEYEQEELELSNFQVDYTLPTSYPYGVEIPSQFLWVFSNNKFKLGGYEIPLEEKNGVRYVNLAYFVWQDFRDALDELEPNGEFKHQSLKTALMPLWDYVAEQVENQNFIVV